MLRSDLHPEVYSDIDGIMERYETLGSPDLLMSFMLSCAAA